MDDFLDAKSYWKQWSLITRLYSSKGDFKILFREAMDFADEFHRIKSTSEDLRTSLVIKDLEDAANRIVTGKQYFKITL